MTGAGLGWLLPYLVVAVVAAVELTADRLSVGGFVALAPLLASRLSSRRGQVVATGVTALLVGFALGAYTGKAVGLQLGLRLLLIALATLFALVNWGASRREQSALERAADTIQMAAGLAAGLAAGVEPEEAYALLARSAGTLYAAHATAVYRRHDTQMVAVAQARDPDIPPMPTRLAKASFPGAFATAPRRASVRAGAEPEASMLEARGLGSLLWLPLLDRAGDLLGTIVLAWRERDPRLSAHALEASVRFASLGARAISGSERVRAQTEVLAQV